MSIGLTRRSLLASAAGAIACSSAPHAAGSVQPLSGVIRWDGWFPGSPYAAAFRDPRWQNRLPTFTTDRNGELCVCGSDIQTIRNDVALAKSAGIDYFAFDYYYPIGPNGKPRKDWEGMGQALRSFLSLREDGFQFAVNFGVSLATYLSQDHLASVTRELVGMFGQKNYVRVRGNRPVCFLMMFSAEPYLKQDAPPGDKLRAFVDGVRSACADNHLGAPYFVIQNFWPKILADILSAFKFDAVSSYGNPMGLDPSGPGRQLSYAKCAGASRGFWASSRELKLPLVPPISVGWDNRPRFDAEPEYKNKPRNVDYCVPPPKDELAQLVRDGMGAARLSNPEFPSVLIYAWNEYVEGGYIAPTKGESAARLDAVREGVRLARLDAKK